MLGVYIVRYQGGPTSLYGGDAKWNTVILDLRNDFMNLSNNQDIEEFYPVIASDLGICVGVVRMLPGSRLNDHLVAWLFIPQRTSISGQKLYDKLRELREIIGESKIDVGKCHEIENWKSNNDIDTNFLLSKQKSDSKAYFRVETTDFNMIEILDKLYQESYFYYKVVYLLKMKDRSCSFPVDWDMENISEKFVEETKSLQMPQIPAGIKVIIGESTLSTENNSGNYCIPSNINKARVTRDGFKDILVSRLLDFENDHFFSKLSWEKIINGDFFTINSSDKKNQKISSFALTVNGKNLHSDSDEICLPENKLFEVNVAVEANGYKKYEGTVDLKNCSSKSPFVIELTKEKKAYDLVIPYSVKSRKDKTKYSIFIEDWRDCSIEGYRTNEYKNNEIHFKYDSRYWIRSNGKLIILVLFLVLLLGGGIGSGSMIIKNNISERKYTDSIGKLNNEISRLKSEGKQVISEETDADYAGNTGPDTLNTEEELLLAAIAYFDTAKTWNRDSMEHYGLQGLWDDLNLRNSEKLVNIWNKKMEKSSRWESIMKACGNIAIKNWKNKLVSDKNIEYDSYIKSAFGNTKTEKKTTAKETKVSGYQNQK